MFAFEVFLPCLLTGREAAVCLLMLPLRKDNGLLRASSAAITALLISLVVLVCPSAHLCFSRADEHVMVSCHLLDLRRNCTRLAADCNYGYNGLEMMKHCVIFSFSLIVSIRKRGSHHRQMT